MADDADDVDNADDSPRRSSNKEKMERYFLSKVVGGNIYVCLLCNPGWTRETTGHVNTHKAISINALKMRMFKIRTSMTETMKNELSSAIGVAFDGWTESSVHYLAVFAVGPSVKGGKVLLGFSPFDQEDKLDADEHIDYITSVLHVFDKDIATDVAYFAADNCSTNRSVATKTNIPLIGCNSHKLNLAVSSFFGLRHEPGRVDTRSVLQKARAQRLESVSSVMIKFRTIKGRATLKKYSTKGAILANKTRWNGNYRMLIAYG
jgi:hypothetical protein